MPLGPLARRYPRHDHHPGHAWQGRFQLLSVQDEHLATVIRHVERNAS